MAFESGEIMEYPFKFTLPLDCLGYDPDEVVEAAKHAMRHGWVLHGDLPIHLSSIVGTPLSIYRIKNGVEVDIELFCEKIAALVKIDPSVCLSPYGTKLDDGHIRIDHFRIGKE